MTHHVAPQDATLECCVLRSTHLMSVAGPDAQKFLQGQLTCDIHAVTAEQASRGAHCTPKGRAIASFTVAQAAETDYVFALPTNNAEALSKALGKYIVFSKAKIAAKTDWVAIGIQGEGANDWAHSVAGISSENSASLIEGGLLVRRGDNRYQLWLEQEELVKQWSHWLADTQLIDEEQWAKGDIDQGLCDIVEATREAFIPPMFGLKEDDGISYKKGCYTGQEIVARLHFLGQQKRALFRFTSETPVNVGDDVCNQANKSLGTVAAYAQGQGLAVLSLAATDDALQINGQAIQHEQVESPTEES